MIRKFDPETLFLAPRGYAASLLQLICHAPHRNRENEEMATLTIPIPAPAVYTENLRPFKKIKI